MNTLIYNSTHKKLVIVKNNLQWQEDNIDPPKLSFEYDFLFYELIQKVKYFKDKYYVLSDDEIIEIESFIESLTPPPTAIVLKDIEDIELFKKQQLIHSISQSIYHSIDTLCRTLNYRDLTDVLITANDLSTDKYKPEAIKILEFNDNVWGEFYKIEDKLLSLYLDKQELPSLINLQQQLPAVPDIDYFSS